MNIWIWNQYWMNFIVNLHKLILIIIIILCIMFLHYCLLYWSAAHQDLCLWFGVPVLYLSQVCINLFRLNPDTTHRSWSSCLYCLSNLFLQSFGSSNHLYCFKYSRYGILTWSKSNNFWCCLSKQINDRVLLYLGTNEKARPSLCINDLLNSWSSLHWTLQHCLF